MIFFYWISKIGALPKKLLASAVIAVSIYTGVVIQSFSYNLHRESIIEEQKYGKS